MFLKQIDVFGFKSFADKCSIQFNDGITALVGPNGCGKSNVVDAIKWVLGEQGAKSLRADRMEDVIFNGTDARKPLNVAEVTLTFSNDTGVLPLEMPEVTVKRRLFRSGESEYFVNNTPVKLKELRELFYDTGLGKTAYSIMEQGKIDSILSTKPEERRYIFEEAAAITKYKQRGREAEKKLERTEENMRQVDSVLGEVKRTYDSLKRQAEKTESYRKLREEIFSVELDLQLLRLKNATEEQEKKQEQLGRRVEQRDALKHKIDGLNSELEKNLDLVNSMENKLFEAQKNLYGIELEHNNLDNQYRMLTERSEELAEKIESEQKKLNGFDGKLAEFNRELETRNGELNEARERIETLDKNISEFEGHVAAAAERIKANEKRIERNSETVENAESEREKLQQDIRAITDDIVEQLDEKLKASGYSGQKRSQLEQQIAQVLDSIEMQAQAREELYRDAGSFEKLSAEQARRLYDGLVGAYERVGERVAELRTAFAEYRDATPSFLDEFLAPEGIITKKREIDAEMERLRGAIKAAREDSAAATAENRELQKKVEQYRNTLEELRVSRAQMKSREQTIVSDIERTKRAVEDQKRQKEQTQTALQQDQVRLEQTQLKIRETNEKRVELKEQEEKKRAELKELEAGISSKNSDLVAKEKQVKQLMQELSGLQDKVEKLQVSAAETTSEIRNIYTNFEEQHSRDLREHEPRMLEIQAQPRDLRTQLSGLREKLRSLGSVNLMAPEEFAEVSERYEFLAGQLDDLRQAKEDLEQVTTEIKAESAELFLETYNKIKKNFHTIIRRLFGGGRAELRLTDPDNVLESGIQVFVQPPGKKLESIELLSGGERSMVAVALLFSTFMVRPSPFCLLDELDAALDETNVGRFVNMLDEFSESSQFVVITHNKKTIASAGTMIGVTMEESGVSKVVAIRVSEPEKVHA